MGGTLKTVGEHIFEIEGLKNCHVIDFVKHSSKFGLFCLASLVVFEGPF